MEANTSLNEYLEKTSQLIKEVFSHPPKVTLSEIQGFDYEGAGPEEEGTPVSFSAISVVGLWYAHPLDRENIASSAWRLDKIDPEDGMLVEIGEWDTFEETLFQIIVSIAAQFAHEALHLEEEEGVPDAVITIHRDGMDITVAFAGEILEAIDEDGHPVELTETEKEAVAELINAGVNEMGMEVH